MLRFLYDKNMLKKKEIDFTKPYRLRIIESILINSNPDTFFILQVLQYFNLASDL